MWPFSKKLDDLVGQTKTVRLHGVKFVIKKMDVPNFLDGSKVLLQSFDVYSLAKKADIPQASMLKLKEHYRDVFMASVVEPKLKRKSEEKEGIFVDHLFTEWDLATKLYEAIVEFTYGKKK